MRDDLLLEGRRGALPTLIDFCGGGPRARIVFLMHGPRGTGARPRRSPRAARGSAGDRRRATTMRRASGRVSARWSAIAWKSRLSCSPVTTSVATSSVGRAPRRSSVRSESSGSTVWSRKAFSCCSRIAARTGSVAVGSQNTTFTSVAASSSPASSASPSAAKNPRISSDHGVPGSGGSASTSPATRPGCAAARSSATRPPNDAPTTSARSIAAASSTSRTSAAWLNEPTGDPERPKPRRSSRVRANRVCHAAHWGSHIRLSATPAWIRTTSGPAPACSTWSGPEPSWRTACPPWCSVMCVSFVTDGVRHAAPLSRCCDRRGSA